LDAAFLDGVVWRMNTSSHLEFRCMVGRPTLFLVCCLMKMGMMLCELVDLDWWIGLASVFIAFYNTPNFTLAQSSLDPILLLE
jgi:hypothetical protein